MDETAKVVFLLPNNFFNFLFYGGQTRIYLFSILKNVKIIYYKTYQIHFANNFCFTVTTINTFLFL